MTTKQKLQQFKDYYLAGTLAVLAVAAVVLYMVFRFVAPKEEPVLRVAVFDTDLSDEAKEELAGSVRAKLGLEAGAEIEVDSGYSSVNTNEYSRLSLMASSGKVDVAIAGEEVFAELAGYGYFKDLSQFLPGEMQAEYAEALRSFAYESDAAAEDAQQMGEIASGEYAFGLSLSGSGRWKSMTEGSSLAPQEPVLGVIMESENSDSTLGLIQVLMD